MSVNRWAESGSRAQDVAKAGDPHDGIGFEKRDRHGWIV